MPLPTWRNEIAPLRYYFCCQVLHYDSFCSIVNREDTVESAVTRKPKRQATFGSISSGTMRTEDLIPAFAAELDYLGGCTRGERKLINEANRLTDYESLAASDILDELFIALDERAPAYGYFGSHEGDGADYGFWLSGDFPANDAFDGLKVSDTSEVPADYTGEVLVVNDHGNMTLYAATHGKLREVWGVV